MFKTFIPSGFTGCKLVSWSLLGPDGLLCVCIGQDGFQWLNKDLYCGQLYVSVLQIARFNTIAFQGCTEVPECMFLCKWGDLNLFIFYRGNQCFIYKLFPSEIPQHIG